MVFVGVVCCCPTPAHAEAVSLLPTDTRLDVGRLELYERLATVLRRSGLKVSGAAQTLARLEGGASRHKRLRDQYRELRRLIVVGRKALEQLRTDQALDALARAAGLVRIVGPLVAKPGVFSELHFLRGLVLHRRRSKAHAEQAFYKAALLNPEFEPSPTAYPPDLVRAYSRSRNAAREAARCPLTVASEPSGAKVVIDGRVAGVSPVVLRLTPTEHYIRLERRDYLPAFRVVSRCATAPITVSMARRFPATDRRRLMQLPGEKLRQTAARVGVQRLLLLQLKREQTRNQLNVRSCDLRSAPTVKCRRQVLVLPERPSGAHFSPVLAALRTPAKRNTWARNGWFWTTVGAVTVAAALAIILPITLADSKTEIVIDGAQ